MAKNKVEHLKIYVPADLQKEGKNKMGEKGEICNNCGGYGFTMSIKSQKLPCSYCKESGVKELSKDEMQDEIYALKKDIHMLRQALLKDLGFHNITVPNNVKKANHAQ